MAFVTRKHVTASNHFWTYVGTKGKNATIMGHATKDAAKYHYGMMRSLMGHATKDAAMMRSLGGDFNVIGITTRHCGAQEIIDGLAATFPDGVTIGNPD